MSEMRRKVDLFGENGLTKKDKTKHSAKRTKIMNSNFQTQQENEPVIKQKNLFNSTDILEQSQQLLMRASSESSKIRNYTVKYQQKIDDRSIENEDGEKILESYNMMQSSHPGITQASGLENEIVKLIERKITESTDSLNQSRIKQSNEDNNVSFKVNHFV